MLNEAVDLMRKDKTVMYIDSELSDRLFMCRLVSHLTGIEFISNFAFFGVIDIVNLFSG